MGQQIALWICETRRSDGLNVFTLVWCAVFLDGPHILKPADLAFGSSPQSLEETGEAVTDPEMAPRAWGLKPTPENLEPGLVEALEAIKDALSKDTYVVHTLHLARGSLLNVFLFGTGRASSVSAKERVWLRPSPHWCVHLVVSIQTNFLTHHTSWRNRICIHRLSWMGNLYTHHC